MDSKIFTPENCDGLKSTCEKIVSILNENVGGSLMASQLMALGDNIKEFTNSPIVKTSGIIK